MEITQVRTLNVTGVFSESKRIIKANKGHFFILSFLFIPLSISLIIFSIQLFFSNHQKPLTSYLLYTLVVTYALTLCAIGAITYSTHNAFFSEPVKSFDSIKSLTFSFFPLALTTIIAHVIIVLIVLSFFLFVRTVVMLMHNVGFVMDYNSVYLIGFLVIMGVILIAIVVYFHVEWSLAFVVVVVESKWGFAALIRSSYLVKGMRLVSLKVMLHFGALVASFVWMCSFNWTYHSWMVVVFVTMFYLLLMMLLLVQMTVANTVLYNYCKALHGELALDVAEPGGFVHKYMNLPSDGENVPHVVGIVAV